MNARFTITLLSVECAYFRFHFLVTVIVYMEFSIVPCSIRMHAKLFHS
jgi:hypothetical protein